MIDVDKVFLYKFLNMQIFKKPNTAQLSTIEGLSNNIALSKIAQNLGGAGCQVSPPIICFKFFQNANSTNEIINSTIEHK